MPNLRGILSRGLKALKKRLGYYRLSQKEKKELSSAHLKYPDRPTVYFELRKNSLHRRVYTFLKFFDLERINVVVEDKQSTLNQILSNTYNRWLIDEKIIRLKKTAITTEKSFSTIQKKGFIKISDDYFNDDAKSVYIPMTMHPAVYKQNDWNKDYSDSFSRVNFMFFAGNFKSDYSKSKNFQKLNILNRIVLLERLSAVIPVIKITSKAHLHEDHGEKKMIIVDSQLYNLPQEFLRLTLAKYRFFLAAPGIRVPHAHNLIEAISVGTIPVIQRGYSDLNYPPLRHKVDALIYDDKEDLKAVIEEAFSLTDDVWATMKENVLDYYDKNLSPKAVIGKVMSEKIDQVRLLSTSNSIKYWRS